MSTNTQYAIGIMSGTSADGADAVLLCQSQNSIKIIDSESLSYSPEIRQQLDDIYHTKIHISQLGQLDYQLAQIYSQLCLPLIQRNPKIKISVIGCHGQTVYHQPQAPNPFTIQIGNAALLCEKTGIAVVSDFRRADMAAGGQGAPLVPAFHQALFAQRVPCAVINIGGIANITYLLATENQVYGYDCGPGNTLIDLVCRQHFNQAFDIDGLISRSGQCHSELLESMLNDPYFKKATPKSTGLEYFNREWLAHKLSRYKNISNEDLLNTLTHLTAATIAEQINNMDIKAAYLCGGGALNPFLVDRIKSYSHCPISTTDVVNIAPQQVEAAAFAWMALRTLQKKTSCLHTVTGASKNTIAGCIYLPNP